MKSKKRRNRCWKRDHGAGLRALVVPMLVVLVMVAGAGFGLSGCTVEVGGQTDSSGQSTTTATAGSDITSGDVSLATNSTPRSTNVVSTADGLASPAEPVADILGPSVVNITVKVTALGPFGQQYYGTAEGSGVIYSSDGLIITNNHVVTNNGSPVDEIEVRLITGERLPATVVGTDSLTDLAVIKVDSDNELPPATFTTEQPRVGEYAIAIGSPLGYENSVTLGIVSGLGRSVEGATGTEGIALTNLIQTDAPISPGNSGGALANAGGQVIGINVAYEPPGTGAVSIGFAIPSVVVTQVADEIITTGKATHAYMGVRTLTVTSELQRQYGLSRSSGILVADVTAEGPAAKAGIQRGDIIVEVDGEEMTESADLLVAIRDKKPGEKVEVVIDRNGTTMTLTVTLEERPPDTY